ncbi:D-alanyl-D-alanine carboxypeptidase family protein [Jannaschia rubra]|uniref:serine-type D-Ala-D-Ala carboxypeptidase n=1 Tax=Jannaschia rubra TaxID=282197 RepID=A0A0M6XTW5_9RHOB|nr:D-alanyl-D-alanine carboxypeptidase family protein [Jannaschia rubra]CTQ34198.1 D-alanyl-D-alanine carboxypeptidase DacF precursor [Jannaschia rubra]SFG20823.1 D-alanyl-D-alanine carboxypeptidase (penicillin-binding protein 5/6) [Jannaschia rubra]
MLRPLIAALLLASPALAQEFSTQAGSAVVVDHNTGQTLLSKNADVPLPPASMSKLMTLYMVFEALEDGRLTLDTELPVSAHAAQYGGSTMFLDPRDRVRVEDLIRGVVVLSGNDATAVLAEALSPDGTEDGFAQMMTERAHEIGMGNSMFRNSNGWPAAGHVMSMNDLAILAEKLITDFPQYYPYFAEREFAFDGRSPSNRFNRNPLLTLGIGADGLKTGHTQEAGYGLVGSAVQGDRRVTFVISGLESPSQRADESERIVNWAFRQFAEVDLAVDAIPAMTADVFMGEAATVPLVPEVGLTMLLPTSGREAVSGEIAYDGPIEAPVEAGTRLGTLTLAHPGIEPMVVPLVAGADVPRAGPLRRIQIAGGRVAGEVLGTAMERFR